MGNKTAWNCDICRKRGLEKKRRCGWLGNNEGTSSTIVWARGRSVSTTCPTSYITSESIALLEEFNAWKLVGGGNVHHMPARLVEAFFLLETEVRAELTDGQK